jgi:pyruvate,water dikinase
MELIRIGKLIERHYGIPQDIEWAFDNHLSFPDNMMILQSRPETVWSRKKRGPVLTPRANLLEMMVDRLKEGRRLRSA